MSTTKTRHVISYSVRNYPSSGRAHSITWSCSCGRSGRAIDGRVGLTMARAKARATSHTFDAPKPAQRATGDDLPSSPTCPLHGATCAMWNEL